MRLEQVKRCTVILIYGAFAYFLYRWGASGAVTVSIEQATINTNSIEYVKNE